MTDATDVFTAMHPKSAFGVLKKLKSRPAKPNNDPTARAAAWRSAEEAAFRVMRSELEKEGMFEVHPLDVTLRTLATVAFFPAVGLVVSCVSLTPTLFSQCTEGELDRVCGGAVGCAVRRWRVYYSRRG